MRSFRDHLIAATLKPNVLPALYRQMGSFRDHLIAATLKRAMPPHYAAIPRSPDRGHIEVLPPSAAPAMPTAIPRSSDRGHIEVRLERDDVDRRGMSVLWFVNCGLDGTSRCGQGWLLTTGLEPAPHVVVGDGYRVDNGCA